MQIARGVEEREYQGLEEVEDNDDFEAEELVESAAGLKNRFEALVKSEDSCDSNDGGDCSNDTDLSIGQRKLRSYRRLLAN